MKSRVVKKVERRMLVDKVCELQREICEYDRFLYDLVIMISRREASTVREHGCHEWAGWIWDHIRDMIENDKGQNDLERSE